MAPFELPPEVYVSQGVLGAVHTVSEMKIFDLRPHFFKFVVYRHIWSLFNVGILNQDEKIIPVIIGVPGHLRVGGLTFLARKK